MTAHRATALPEVPGVAKPEPLDDKTWAAFFVNTDDARGRKDSLQIVAQFRGAHSEPEATFALFAGHTGCGKSTELARVGHELRDLYQVVFSRVDRHYSLPALDYRQVLFLCSELLLGEAAKVEATVSDQDMKRLREWFDVHTVEEATKRGWKAEAEVGGKVGWLSQLYLRFSGKLSSAGETREKAMKYVEERFDLLVDNMEVVVKAIEAKVAPRRVLLVIEGLDKIENPEQGRRLFSDHRLELLQLPCSAVFTYPIRLWYDADPALMTYPVRHLLPMIPAAEPPRIEGVDRSAGELKKARGLNALKRIVLQRVDERLISEEAIDWLIKKSGGVLRDLLQMIARAALEAQVDKSPRIELTHAQMASRTLRAEYANRLSPPAYGEHQVSFDDIWKTLGRSYEWPRRDANQTLAFKMLLQSLCILEYNGDCWHDLHPLVREHLELREAEQRARSTPS